MAIYSNTASETVDLLENTSGLIATLRTVAESIDLNDNVVHDYVNVLSEILYVGDDSTALGILYQTLEEAALLSEAVNLAFEQLLLDTFTIADATDDKVIKLVNLIEALQMADELNSRLTE